MSVSDLFSAWGAGLSTILAILQYRQWRKQEEVVSVRIFGECLEEYGSDLCLTVTNLTSHSLGIEFIGIGFGYRKWLTPWKISPHEIDSLELIGADGCSTGKTIVDPLDAGAAADFCTRLNTMKELEAAKSFRLGFNWCHYVWIDHTRSQQHFRARVLWGKYA